jgi:hypothetical protein
MIGRLEQVTLGAAVALLAASAVLAQDRPPPGSGVAPTHPLDTIKELHAAFFACWKGPPPEQSRPGTEITVRFTLTRSGEIQGEPGFTFLSRDLPPEIRAAYQRSIVDALRRCTPFPLTPALGNATAGRPHALRVIDVRGQRKAELSHAD